MHQLEILSDFKKAGRNKAKQSELRKMAKPDYLIKAVEAREEFGRAILTGKFDRLAFCCLELDSTAPFSISAAPTVFYAIDRTMVTAPREYTEFPPVISIGSVNSEGRTIMIIGFCRYEAKALFSLSPLCSETFLRTFNLSYFLDWFLYHSSEIYFKPSWFIGLDRKNKDYLRRIYDVQRVGYVMGEHPRLNQSLANALPKITKAYFMNWPKEYLQA